MERLTKAYSDGTHGASDSLPCGENSYDYKNLLIDKLGKYEDLEEQGRLIKLPCDFGATLFWISTEDDNGNKCLTIRSYGEDEPIEAIAVDREGKLYVATQDYALDYFDELGGKYALLSKKDAEAKLKELRGANDGSVE